MPSTITGVVAPHKKISRLVTEADLTRVYEDAEVMHRLNNRPLGIWRRFYAMAHPQCVTEDPLRFFVLNNIDKANNVLSLVIINPVILKHTNSEIDSEEGCASFQTMPAKIVSRWNKCEVSFTEMEFKFEDGDYRPIMGARKTANLSGKIAKIFQHEIDHLNAKYIYQPAALEPDNK